MSARRRRPTVRDWVRDEMHWARIRLAAKVIDVGYEHVPALIDDLEELLVQHNARGARKVTGE